MENTVRYLEHKGQVTDCRNGRIKITLAGSGCSACHKSLCMLGDSKALEVELPFNTHDLKIGDEVLLKINPSAGYKAVAFLYLFPFLLMFGSLVLLLRIGYSEGISGLTALLSLVPYFIILHGCRVRLGGQCRIDVEKNEFSNCLYHP